MLKAEAAPALARKSTEALEAKAPSPGAARTRARPSSYSDRELEALRRAVEKHGTRWLEARPSILAPAPCSCLHNRPFASRDASALPAQSPRHWCVSAG